MYDEILFGSGLFLQRQEKLDQAIQSFECFCLKKG
jgi:hypothetical protein